MARPLRLVYPGAVYHITARGNERKEIYRTDADRTAFLSILSQAVERYNAELQESPSPLVVLSSSDASPKN